MDTLDANTPYCGACGHDLTGLVDSSKCPECGRPLVEVLTRGVKWGKRRRSKVTLFGLPLVDIALGPVPGEPRGHARGIFAIGDRATGFVAMGGRSTGIVAFGGVAMGVFAFGGVALGVLGAWGGVALAALAAGGLAVGLISNGGLAVGYVATGGLAVGYYVAGGAPMGAHTIGPQGSSPEAAAMISKLTWFYGPTAGFSVWNMVQPLIAITGIALVVVAVIGLLAVLAHLRLRDPGDDAGSGP